MLRAAAEPGQDQPGDHAVERAAEARQRVAAGDQQRAEGQHADAAETLGQHAGRDLAGGHGAGIAGLEGTDGAVAQPELRLQQRVEDVQEIGETVMQGMRAAADGEGAAGGGDRRRRR